MKSDFDIKNQDFGFIRIQYFKRLTPLDSFRLRFIEQLIHKNLLVDEDYFTNNALFRTSSLIYTFMYTIHILKTFNSLKIICISLNWEIHIT